MNILIKGADFSQVSIGTAGKQEEAVILTNSCLSSSGVCYVNSGAKTVGYNISGCKVLKITGKPAKYYGYIVAVFYGNEISGSSAVTFTSSSDATTYNSGLGTRTGAVYSEETTATLETFEVIVPEGAKSVIINAGNENPSNISLAQLA